MAKRLPDSDDAMKWMHDEFRKLVAEEPDPREAFYDRFADDRQAQLKIASVAIDHAWKERLGLRSDSVDEPLARLMKESPDPSKPSERRRMLAEVLDMFPDHKADAGGTSLVKILFKGAYDRMLKKPGKKPKPKKTKKKK